MKTFMERDAEFPYPTQAQQLAVATNMPPISLFPIYVYYLKKAKNICEIFHEAISCGGNHFAAFAPKTVERLIETVTRLHDQ